MMNERGRDGERARGREGEMVRGREGERSRGREVLRSRGRGAFNLFTLIHSSFRMQIFPSILQQIFFT